MLRAIKNKTLVKLILTLFIVASITACNSGGSGGDSPPSEQPSPENPTPSPEDPETSNVVSGTTAVLTGAVDEVESNDSASEAQSINEGDIIVGSIDAASQSDVFTLNAGEDKCAAVYFSDSTNEGQLELELINGSDVVLDTSGAGTTTRKITLPVDGGTIFLKVKRVDVDAQYALEVNSCSALAREGNGSFIWGQQNELLFTTTEPTPANPIKTTLFDTVRLTESVPYELKLSDVALKKAHKAELWKDPTTVFVEENVNITSNVFSTNDPWSPIQWGHDNVNIAGAWAVETGDPSKTTIAVIDSGLNLHRDFNPSNIVDGYDFVSNVSFACDDDARDADYGDACKPDGVSSHGTGVAGIIGAVSNNSQDVAGIVDAKIMPLRALGVNPDTGSGSGSSYDIAAAVLYAAGLTNDAGVLPSQKANIINMSLGAPTYIASLATATASAINEGLIVVAAAGNDGMSTIYYPAGATGVFGVAATDIQGNRTSYSNMGDHVDIAAPGGASGDINNDGYQDGIIMLSNLTGISNGSGTSMAAPYVAGIFGLMHSIYPEITTSDIEKILQNNHPATTIKITSKDPYTYDENLGYGIIDAEKAAMAAHQLKVAAEPAPSDPTTIVASHSELNFGWLDSTLIMDAQSGSDVDLSNFSVTSSAEWLTPSITSTDPINLIRVDVNREGLTAAATANLTLSADNADPITIPVSVKAHVAGNKNVGSLYLALVDVTSGDILDSTTVSFEGGEYSFQISNPEDNTVSRVFIAIGTDRDSDNVFCEPGDYCYVSDNFAPNTEQTLNDVVLLPVTY